MRMHTLVFYLQNPRWTFCIKIERFDNNGMKYELILHRFCEINYY